MYVGADAPPSLASVDVLNFMVLLETPMSSEGSGGVAAPPVATGGNTCAQRPIAAPMVTGLQGGCRREGQAEAT